MNQEVIIDRLKKAFGAGHKIVFFVGAGISVPSEVKDFQKFNKEVIQEITNGELQEIDYKILSNEIRPEVMLQIGIEELGSEMITCLEKLLGSKPNFNHFFLAEAVKQGNIVFTTNLENLIEDACKIKRVKFEKYYTDSDFKKFYEQHISNPSSITGGCIFKPHGTIEENRTGKERFASIRIALEQVGKGLTDYSKRVLKYFLENYDFYFMGYSSRDDFSIYPVLLNTKSDKTVFWLQYQGGKGLESITRERIEDEIRQEKENKPWRGEKRNWEIINVDDFLLKREKSLKFVGDSSEFIKNLCQSFNIDVVNSDYKAGNTDLRFAEWVKKIEKPKKNIFAGRLFEHIGFWGKAGEYYKKAEEEAKKSGQGTIIAKQRLANLYTMQTELEKENEAINIYKECIGLSGDSINKVTLTFDIINVERRLGIYPEKLKEWAKEAREKLEVVKDKDAKNYARCLNILGLGHLRGSEDDIKAGLNYCRESKRLMNKLGDKDGEAAAENAIALLLKEQGNKLAQRDKVLAKKEFNKAIAHLKRAIDIRIKYSFFRGCAQHSRNIGDAYEGLMKIESKRKLYYFRKSEENYEISLNYLDLVKPKAPVGEIVNWRQRIAGLYRDFCKLADDKRKKGCISKIISIYNGDEEGLMKNDETFYEIKRKDKENKTAKTILEDAWSYCKELGLCSEMKEINELLKKLTPET